MAEASFGSGPMGARDPAVAGPRIGPGGLARKAGLTVRLMGGAVSLALLAGMAVWGYRLVLRDATGVPVVTAMDGPMRQAPGDPGGQLSIDAGLSVNAVLARGEAAPPEDRLILAPATADLTEEDLLVQPTAEADEYLPGDADTVVPAAALTPPRDEPMTAEDILALADAISAGATPMAALSDEPLGAPTLTDGAGTLAVAQGSVDTIPVPAAAETAPSIDADIATPDFTITDADPFDEVESDAAPVVQPVEEVLADIPQEPALAAYTSLRPVSRPGGIAAAAPAESITVSTAPVALGTALVQLGAFNSAALAGTEWDRLSAGFADFLSGKERLVQEASSGGQVFYRLRATGFSDIADARRFCAALVAERAACIPFLVQ